MRWEDKRGEASLGESIAFASDLGADGRAWFSTLTVSGRYMTKEHPRNARARAMRWYRKARQMGLRWQGEPDDLLPLDCPPESYGGEWHEYVGEAVARQLRRSKVATTTQMLQWAHFVAEDVCGHVACIADVSLGIGHCLRRLTDRLDGRFAAPHAAPEVALSVPSMSDEEFEQTMSDLDDDLDFNV